MLAELRAKSQVTIPKEVVTRLGIKEGDKLEITEKDGVIQLIPVVVYPKKYVDELKSEIDGIKAKVADGTQPTFDNIDSLFDAIGEIGMAYQFTFTDRFKKHFKKLNANEKKQLMSKLELLSENPMHPIRCVPSAYREQSTCLSAA